MNQDELIKRSLELMAVEKELKQQLDIANKRVSELEIKVRRIEAQLKI
ncbi:hypothetical protein [Brevibacillus sp. HD1.4A]|nr:hypothetical protein [Brevibacillus sp. HD1.4A]NRQ56081.1 hypothetical protein [Brevibacillus sp. HD1.4A]